MKNRISIVLAGLVLGFTSAAQAETNSHADLRLNISDLDVTVPGLGSGSDDGSGLELRGAFGIAPNIQLLVRYSSVELDDTEWDVERMQFGGRLDGAANGSNFNPFGSLSYESIEIDDVDDDGIVLRGGLNFGGGGALSGDVSLGYIAFSDVDGFELAGTFAGRINKQVSVVVGVSMADVEDDNDIEYELQEISAGIRVHF